MTNGTRRGWGVSVTPRSLFTPGKTRYPLHRWLGGPQSWSGRVRKISPPSGFDPRTVQPVASRNTTTLPDPPPIFTSGQISLLNGVIRRHFAIHLERLSQLSLPGVMSACVYVRMCWLSSARGAIIIANRILLGKSEGKRLFWRPSCRWENDVKLILK
jgi:hypothetical protein